MNEESYPSSIKIEDLDSFGAEQIEGMTYYRLGKAIYEPVYNEESKIDFYALRRFIR